MNNRNLGRNWFATTWLIYIFGTKKSVAPIFLFRGLIGGSCFKGSPPYHLKLSVETDRPRRTISELRRIFIFYFGRWSSHFIGGVLQEAVKIIFERFKTSIKQFTTHSWRAPISVLYDQNYIIRWHYRLPTLNQRTQFNRRKWSPNIVKHK